MVRPIYNPPPPPTLTPACLGLSAQVEELEAMLSLIKEQIDRNGNSGTMPESLKLQWQAAQQLMNSIGQRYRIGILAPTGAVFRLETIGARGNDGL